MEQGTEQDRLAARKAHLRSAAVDVKGDQSSRLCASQPRSVDRA